MTKRYCAAIDVKFFRVGAGMFQPCKRHRNKRFIHLLESISLIFTPVRFRVRSVAKSGSSSMTT